MKKRSSGGAPVHVPWSLCGAAACAEAGHPSHAGQPSQLLGRRCAGPRGMERARPPGPVNRDSPTRGPRRLLVSPVAAAAPPACSRGPRAPSSTDHAVPMHDDVKRARFAAPSLPTEPETQPRAGRAEHAGVLTSAACCSRHTWVRGARQVKFRWRMATYAHAGSGQQRACLGFQLVEGETPLLLLLNSCSTTGKSTPRLYSQRCILIDFRN